MLDINECYWVKRSLLVKARGLLVPYTGSVDNCRFCPYKIVVRVLVGSEGTHLVQQAVHKAGLGLAVAPDAVQRLRVVHRVP